MLANENKSLFNEVTTEDSATVSGGQLGQSYAIVGLNPVNQLIMLGAALAPFPFSDAGIVLTPFEVQQAWLSQFVTRPI